MLSQMRLQRYCNRAKKRIPAVLLLRRISVLPGLCRANHKQPRWLNVYFDRARVGKTNQDGSGEFYFVRGLCERAPTCCPCVSLQPPSSVLEYDQDFRSQGKIPHFYPSLTFRCCSLRISVRAVNPDVCRAGSDFTRSNLARFPLCQCGKVTEGLIRT